MDSFFGIGLFELFLIAVIALVVLGPERLPGAMRTLADYMRQIRAMSSEFTSQFSEEIKMLEEMNPRRMVSDVLDPAKTPDAAKPAPTKAASVRPATPGATAKTDAATKSTNAPPAGDQNSIVPPAGDTSAAEKPLAARTPPATAASSAAPAVDSAAPSSALPENATSAPAEDPR